MEICISERLPGELTQIHLFSSRGWQQLQCKTFTGEKLGILYIAVLTPRTSECDLIWRWGLDRGNQVKMSSPGWALLQ